MARARTSGGARVRARHPWLQGLACGALLAFAPAFAVLFAALLAPAIIAVLLDGQPGRPVARAVFFAGSAFTFVPALHLFQGGPTLAAAMDLVAQPSVLTPAWIAGASGWALCELLPVVLRVTSDMNAAARVASLQAEAKALRESWDLPSES